MDWINRHIGATEHATLTDVSAMFCVLSAMGPKARELLARVSPDDLSPEALKFSHTREIDVGFARVRAARMSYVGGPGFELYVPVEMARHVYLALHEAGRRAWGVELGPDETPFEAGLSCAVKLDKPADFIGKAALRKMQGEPLRKKLVTVVLGSADQYAWGGEALSIGGEAAGELSSVGWSPKAGACVALAYVHGDTARRSHCDAAAEIDLWGEPVNARVWDRWPATR